MQVFFEAVFIKDFEALEPEMKRRVMAICLDDISGVESIGNLRGTNVKKDDGMESILSDKGWRLSYWF